MWGGIEEKRAKTAGETVQNNKTMSKLLHPSTENLTRVSRPDLLQIFSFLDRDRRTWVGLKIKLSHSTHTPAIA